jgi:hypothetical protein
MLGNLQVMLRPAAVQAKEAMSVLEHNLDMIAKGVSGRFYRGNASAQLEMDLVESQEDLDAAVERLIARRA